MRAGGTYHFGGGGTHLIVLEGNAKVTGELSGAPYVMKSNQSIVAFSNQNLRFLLCPPGITLDMSALPDACPP